MGLVEITTPPSHGVEEITSHYLSNLELALGVASELGLGVVSIGDVPPPDKPLHPRRPRLQGQGQRSRSQQVLARGRCAGAHLHLELPAGTVWPDVKAALDAPLAAQRELLGPTTSPPPSTRRSWPSPAPALSRTGERLCRQDGPLQGHPRLRRSLRGSARGRRLEPLREPCAGPGRSAEGALQGLVCGDGPAGWSAGSSRRRGQSAQGFVEPGAFEPPRHRRDQEHGRQLSRDGAGGLRPHPWRCREIRHERLEVRPAGGCSPSSPMETCFTCRFSPT